MSDDYQSMYFQANCERDKLAAEVIRLRGILEPETMARTEAVCRDAIGFLDRHIAKLAAELAAEKEGGEWRVKASHLEMERDRARKNLAFARLALKQSDETLANLRAQFQVGADAVERESNQRAVEVDSLKRGMQHKQEQLDALQEAITEGGSCGVDNQEYLDVLKAWAVEVDRLKAENVRLVGVIEEVINDEPTCSGRVKYILFNAIRELKPVIDWQARYEQLQASFTELEPCGHPKNFLIGDDYGHFSCTVCGSKAWQARYERLAAAARPIAEYVDKFTRDLRNSCRISEVSVGLSKADDLNVGDLRRLVAELEAK